MVATAATAVSKIIGKAVRDGKLCYYINDGVYHTFSGIIFDHCHYHLKAFKRGPTQICSVFGPTCDALDVVSMAEELPADLELGDLLYSEQHRRLQPRLLDVFQRLPARKGGAHQPVRWGTSLPLSHGYGGTNRAGRRIYLPQKGAKVGATTGEPINGLSPLRDGNVHSAKDWRAVLEPVVARYCGRNFPRYFRADAAFANPELHQFLEAGGFEYAIRLPGNDALLRDIEPLLTRLVWASLKRAGRLACRLFASGAELGSGSARGGQGGVA